MLFSAYFPYNKEAEAFYFERVKQDRRGNITIHLLIPSNTHNSKSFQLRIDRVIYSFSSFEKHFHQVKENSRRIISTIRELNSFPEIDVSAPNNSDEYIIVPLECSYNKKFFSRMYLLRNHIVLSQIISQFGLLQYQIPIKASNQELLLLICGEHAIEGILFEPSQVEIGKSYISKNDDSIEKSSPIIQLINETKQLLSYEDNILYNTSASTDFFDAIEEFNKWVKRNMELTYEEYLSQSSEIVKWKNEYRLFQFVKLFFPDAIYQFRSEWLEGQSIDIYIPSQRTAIEYQGKQHYEVGFFGGEQKLKENQYRDYWKKEKCEENGIALLEWNYKEKVYYSNVLSFVGKCFPKLRFSNEYIENNLLKYKPLRVVEVLGSNRFHKPEQSKEPIIETVIRAYDERGNVVGEYSSILDAAANKSISASSIQKCLLGQRKTASGLVWMREERGSKPQDIEVVSKKFEKKKTAPYENKGVEKPVIQVDPLTGEIICQHRSIASAARALGISKKGIQDVIKKKQKTAGGFIWIPTEE